MSSSEQHSTNSEHAKKYNFHHVSVSVPITMPTRPGEKIEGHIPFKAPIIHEEPEKTQHPYERSPLYTDNIENFSFFKVDGPQIVPVFNEIEME